jgi:hypothetical protein
MSNPERDKRKIFNIYRRNLEAEGLPVLGNSTLICPLCWREIQFADLRREHILPGSVGGKERVLTCRSCNNNQGSSLDSHLTGFQETRDKFEGNGAFRTVLHIEGHRVAADLTWTKGSKHFQIIEKASDKRAIAAVKEIFASGRYPEIHVTIPKEYQQNKLRRAALRAAYLTIFWHFGYRYISHDVIHTIRKRIVDDNADYPKLETMFLEATDINLPKEFQHVILPSTINGLECLLVIMRIKKHLTSYLGVWLPAPVEGTELFFELMETVAREHDGATWSTTLENAIFPGELRM